MARAATRLAVLTVVLLTLSGCGLTASRSNPGYADLDSLGAFDVDNVMTLSLGSGLLSFAARHTDDDPETRALLGGLDGVRVRIYEIDGDAEKVAGRMDHMGDLQPEMFSNTMAALDLGEDTTPQIEVASLP